MIKDWEEEVVVSKIKGEKGKRDLVITSVYNKED